MYIVAVIVLIVSACTTFGILIDELNAPKNTGARIFFWIGTVISAFILLVSTVIEASNMAQKPINKAQTIHARE